MPQKKPSSSLKKTNSSGNLLARRSKFNLKTLGFIAGGLAVIGIAFVVLSHAGSVPNGPITYRPISGNNINLINADGTGGRVLVSNLNPEGDDQPIWSPKGDKFVVVDNGGNLQLHNYLGTTVTNIIPASQTLIACGDGHKTQSAYLYTAAFSPDGNSIVYIQMNNAVSNTGYCPGTTVLYRANADGSARTAISA